MRPAKGLGTFPTLAIEAGRLDSKALPANWHRIRAEAQRRFGDEWVQGGRSVALLVPSAAILGEWNILVNPVHPDFPKVRFQKPVPFTFDVRMFR